MTPIAPTVLEALRLPELCREVCRYAGVPFASPPAVDDRFVVRSGQEAPDLLAKLLEEAFAEDEAEVLVFQGAERPDCGQLRPGQTIVQSGLDAPCPVADALRNAVRPQGGAVLLFAIERRDEVGRLLGVTWAALPEEEPAPQERFQAAVLRLEG